MKQTQLSYAEHPAAIELAAKRTNLPKLKPTDEQRIFHLRDGEVVLFKRPHSDQWQTRFKLYDRKWRHVSTKQTNLEYAMRAACEAYDEARFRERLGLPITTRHFGDVAKRMLGELRTELAAGTGKAIYKDYLQVTEKYLLPYFGKAKLVSIDYDAVQQFEQWRNETMGKVPKAKGQHAAQSRVGVQSHFRIGDQAGLAQQQSPHSEAEHLRRAIQAASGLQSRRNRPPAIVFGDMDNSRQGRQDARHAGLAARLYRSPALHRHAARHRSNGSLICLRHDEPCSTVLLAIKAQARYTRSSVVRRQQLGHGL